MEKRARATTVALQDEEANGILKEHVRASDATKESMFKYLKVSHKQGPSWPCLHRHRHFLGDVLARTRGHLLTLVPWERQIARFCSENIITLDCDGVNLPALLVYAWRDARVLRCLATFEVVDTS